MCPSEIVCKDYGGRLSDRLPVVAPSIMGLLLDENDSSMAENDRNNALKSVHPQPTSET